MQINYNIKKYECIENSKGVGLIVFELIDEMGKKRIVSTKAKLGFSRKLKAIQAFHHRETPLVEALASSSPNAPVLVDFSTYNKKHKRDGSLRDKKLNCRWNKVTPSLCFSVCNSEAFL